MKKYDNNSIYQNPKAIKKVILIIVCLLIAVFSYLSGRILFGNGRPEKTQSGAACKEQLTQMSEDLWKIENKITSNLEHLREVSINSQETEKNLLDISKQLVELHADLENVSTKIDVQVQEVNLPNALTTLNSTLTEYRTDITAQQQIISEILNTIKSDNSKQHNETIAKISGLQASLSKTESNLKSFRKETMREIEKLKSGMNKNDKELLKALKEVEDSIQSIVQKDISGLRLQLDQSVLSLLEKLQTLQQQVLDTEESISSLVRLADENAGERQNEIRAAFEDVNQSMKQITDDFNLALQEIRQLIVRLQETESGNHNEMLGVLHKLESDMNENSLQSLNKINTSLEHLKNSMEEVLTQSFQDLSGNVTNSFQDLSGTITSSFQLLGGDMMQQHQTVVETIENHSSSLQEIISSSIEKDGTVQKEYIKEIFENSDQEMKEYIKSLFDNVDQKIEQVFTSVSSGKQQCASSLTDKGISTDAKAEFQVIASNIKKIGERSDVIPSGLLVGYTAYVNNNYVSGSMPNNAAVESSLNCGQSYRIPAGYHNGNGKIAANTLASQTQATADAANISKGRTGWVNGRLITGTGADNDAYYNQGYADGTKNALNGIGIAYTYHKHTGNSAGGGCYTAPVYHVHSSSCNTTVQCDCPKYSQGDFLGNHAIDGWPMWECKNCGDGNWHHSDGRCNKRKEVRNCNKTESTIESYGLGCGKTESTIESATVVFP